jgi:methylated-DNA-[protein]-cysteine S-methyltransferase
MGNRNRWIFEAGGGWCGIAWTERGIAGLSLPSARREDATAGLDRSAADAVDSEPDRRALELAGLVGRFLSGEDVDFSAVELDLSGAPPFRRRILEVVRSIPRGQVRTYGQVAVQAGSPRAARAVGGCMAGNPVPLVVPCHRVVGSDGRLVGFSAPGGIASKKRLLAMESGGPDCRNFVTGG